MKSYLSSKLAVATAGGYGMALVAQFLTNPDMEPNVYIRGAEVISIILWTVYLLIRELKNEPPPS